MADNLYNPKPSSSGTYDELGVLGLRQFGGYVREEYHRDLVGEKGKRIYDEMSRDEPIVRALLFAIEKLVEQVKWGVEGAEDDETPDEQIEFVKECLHDMDQPWSDTVVDIMSMATYGFSVHEVVYKQRGGQSTKDPMQRSKFDDGKVGWRGWKIRKQRTVYRWD